MKRIAAVLAVAAIAPHAYAGKQDQSAEPSTEKTTDDEPPKTDKKKELEIGGRVFVRETVESIADGPWLGTLTLDSVRLNVAYEKKRVRVVVKVEAAGGTVKLRDAYVQLRISDEVSLRAGRFKMPVSAVETASRWVLPTIDRGFLSDVYDDGFELAGRRVGAQVSYKPPLPYKPKVQAGAFQSTALGGDAQPGTFDQRYGLIGVLRVSAEPVRGVGLDAWGQSRLAHDTASAVPHREWAAGIDATLDFDDDVGPRAWLELSRGSSALDATPASTDRVQFLATRAIASWRIGHRDKRWYLEPFGTASVLDPDLNVTQDVVWETGVGINGGQWDRWRAQLQFDVRRAYSGHPLRLAGDADLREREAVTLQLGAAF